MDTLSCRLGRQRVLSAKVHRESQPELACSFQPMAGRRQIDGGRQSSVRKLSSRLAQQCAEPCPSDTLRRPSHCFNPPQAIQVAGVWRPTTANAETSAPVPPTLATAAAPARDPMEEYVGGLSPKPAVPNVWKVDGGRAPALAAITTALSPLAASWWWIYRDLNKGTWYLHGLFD